MFNFDMLGFSKKRKVAMEYLFCGVFVFKKRLYLEYQEDMGGPGCIVFPPKELDPGIDGSELGQEIESALSAYVDNGRRIYADEKEELNKQLLNFFGEKSIGAYERKKKGMTVRKETATGHIVLFGPKNKEYVLDNPDTEQLGLKVKELLGIKSRDIR